MIKSQDQDKYAHALLVLLDSSKSILEQKASRLLALTNQVDVPAKKSPVKKGADKTKNTASKLKKRTPAAIKKQTQYLADVSKAVQRASEKLESLRKDLLVCSRASQGGSSEEGSQLGPEKKSGDDNHDMIDGHSKMNL